MKTLLALTALMILLAAAVWWKTRPDDTPRDLAPTSIEDPLRGVIMMGLQGEPQIAEASFPSEKKMSAGTSSSQNSVQVLPATHPMHETAAESAPQTVPLPDTQRAPAVLHYTVQSGDSLYRILVRSYGSAAEELVEAVASANNLENPELLGLGQVLELPKISGYPAPQQP